jgi:chemotaxis protein MotB
MKTIQKEMGATLMGLGLDDQVTIQAGEQELLIIIKENVTFHTGEAAILEGSQPILDTVAGIIKRYPSFQVEIDGHTDDLPINTAQYPSNWELSVARATSVLKYLISGHGLDPARFIITGNAEQRPLFPNMTPEQRAHNRRVEIRLRDHQAT